MPTVSDAQIQEAGVLNAQEGMGGLFNRCNVRGLAGCRLIVAKFG
jgi:hypothetical protein